MHAHRRTRGGFQTRPYKTCPYSCRPLADLDKVRATHHIKEWLLDKVNIFSHMSLLHEHQRAT